MGEKPLLKGNVATHASNPPREWELHLLPDAPLGTTSCMDYSFSNIISDIL
jgi:hypothetical protein